MLNFCLIASVIFALIALFQTDWRSGLILALVAAALGVIVVVQTIREIVQ